MTAGCSVLGQTPVPLGLYAGSPGSTAHGTPGQTDAPGYYPGLDPQWDSFVNTIGTTPTYFTTFSDQCYAPDDFGAGYGWPGQANYQASNMSSNARTKNLIPITTIPFWYDSTCDQHGHPNIGLVDETGNIASGAYDGQITVN